MNNPVYCKVYGISASVKFGKVSDDKVKGLITAVLN